VRLQQARLIFLALVVVKEAALSCGPAPLVPSLGLRMALSFLWSTSPGCSARPGVRARRSSSSIS